MVALVKTGSCNRIIGSIGDAIAAAGASRLFTSDCVSDQRHAAASAAVRCGDSERALEDFGFVPRGCRSTCSQACVVHMNAVGDEAYGACVGRRQQASVSRISV
jgi:hypothetical protein